MLCSVSPNPFGEVTGSTGGWGQCVVLSFATHYFLFFSSTALSFSFPLLSHDTRTAVLSGVYLLQCGSSTGCRSSEVPLLWHSSSLGCSPFREKWASGNFMKFSRGKCKVLHLDRNNSMCQYSTGQPKQLRKKVPGCPDGQQANHELGLPRALPAGRGRSFPLLSALVRPHLEYCDKF